MRSEMARLAAAAVGADEKQALVMSTGVIGVLPADGEDRRRRDRGRRESLAATKPRSSRPPAAS